MCSKRFMLLFRFSFIFCAGVLTHALMELREQLAGIVLSFCPVDSVSLGDTYLHSLSHLASFLNAWESTD